MAPPRGTEPLDVDALAAASDGSTAAPPGTTVGHVHPEVTALAAARAFYVDTLGHRVRTAFPSAPFVAAGEYNHHLELSTWNGRPEPAGGGSRGSNCSCPTSVRWRRLAEAGVPVSGIDGGVEMVDPDGIVVRVGVA